jgi:hypothetical protein
MFLLSGLGSGFRSSLGSGFRKKRPIIMFKDTKIETSDQSVSSVYG